jgi:hypothetical protein
LVVLHGLEDVGGIQRKKKTDGVWAVRGDGPESKG